MLSGHLLGVSADKSLACLADDFIFQKTEEATKEIPALNHGNKETPVDEAVAKSEKEGT